MRFIIGVGLAAAAVTSLAIGAATAPAASPDRIVYHSKLASGRERDPRRQRRRRCAHRA